MAILGPIGERMKRREFLALLTTMGIVWSDAAIGQGTSHIRQIAMLLASSASDLRMQARLAAFQKQLSALGWTEGENIHIELRWFGGDAARCASRCGRPRSQECH
jgi:putative ABC transport system substrate-binding protein